MLEARPDMRLLAETGGKNATIVTSMSDRDQAIKHVVHSAFSHCGQKCSATSLLLLEQEVYDDERFRAALVDAVESLKVGSAWETRNKLGPLIAPPTGDLERGLKELESGESWALMPESSAVSECVFRPGIKWGTRPGSYTHCTEFFGPVLAVMPFRSLSEAIDIVNQTGYGLTSGLESLDDREQQEWLAGIRAGNLYVNRPTTGAIVLRQPFGGMGQSSFGPGIKAGGPNYVAQLMQFKGTDDPHNVEVMNPALRHLVQGLRTVTGELKAHTDRLASTIADYDREARTEFLVEHDHFRLVGEDNIRRYLPITSLCIRVTEQDTWFDLVARAAAAQAVGGRMIVSSPPGVHEELLSTLHDLTETWAADIEFIRQTDMELIDAIATGEIGRIRYAGDAGVPAPVREAVIGRYVHIADSPVVPIGRVELLWYIQEQSVSIDYHRYGNLGARSDEERAPVL